MKVILIAGKARSGKDTSARYMLDYIDYREKKGIIVHYADYLKFICKNYYGWNRKKDEAGRTLLQTVGAKFRAHNEDFWVNAVLNLLEVLEEEYDYVVIPDVRYLNEVQAIREKYDETIAVKIVRPDFDNGLTEEQKNHESENSLGDYRFLEMINDGTLEDLKEMSETIVEVMEG